MLVIVMLWNGNTLIGNNEGWLKTMTTFRMKNVLVNKVINSIDNMYVTKNYRYVWNSEKQLMKRINIECVGRTSYLNPENWEVCEISKAFKEVK